MPLPAETFTYKAERLLRIARTEAWKLGHVKITSGHILLAITMLPPGNAVNVMRNLSMTTERMFRELLKLIPREEFVPTSISITSGDLILIAAQDIARDLNHKVVSVSHIFLACLVDPDSVATRMIQHMGFEIEDVRKEILRGLKA